PARLAGLTVAVLLDTSAVLAAADRADLNHSAAVAWFDRVDEPLLLGALTLTEIDHVLQRALGLPASLALAETIANGAIRLVGPAVFRSRRIFGISDDKRHEAYSAGSAGATHRGPRHVRGS